MSKKLIWSCTILLVGCIDELPEPGPDPDPSPDPEAAMSSFDRDVVTAVADYDDFSEISDKPYLSTVGAFQVNVFASDASRDYKRILPDASGSHVALPPGTIIVREVLDSAGEVVKLTLMAKAEPGYDPRIGDWWFGVTDPDGAPLADGGKLQLGRLEACHGCHLPRAEDDYLFGVLKSDQ